MLTCHNTLHNDYKLLVQTGQQTQCLSKKTLSFSCLVFFELNLWVCFVDFRLVGPYSFYSYRVRSRVDRQLAPVPLCFRYIKFLASALIYKKKRFINTALHYSTTFVVDIFINLTKYTLLF